MELASCFFFCGASTFAPKSPSRLSLGSISLFAADNNRFRHFILNCTNTSTQIPKTRNPNKNNYKTNRSPSPKQRPPPPEPKVNVRGLYQNGDPLGRRDLGKLVVRWLSHGMRAMASDFAVAEVQGEFGEVRGRMGPGLTFVIQAQPYLTAIPMPLGLEAVCLKACTHYPTLFDHFQRELRDVLQELQRKSAVENWQETESWKLLKELANSAQHRAIARKVSQTKTVLHHGLGMELEKAKAIQRRIDDYTRQLSDLLRIERDAELEFTQEELDAVPTPDKSSDSAKPIEFLVSHGQAEQELCDTICNLNAVSTFTGLGGMHLVLFRVEGNHRLPPTTLSPGDMVCVRTCDGRGAGATSSCMQGFVNTLGEDGCSISVALESRPGDPTFSKLFGKTVRIDRIYGLADTITYEAGARAIAINDRCKTQEKEIEQLRQALLQKEDDLKLANESCTLYLGDFQKVDRERVLAEARAAKAEEEADNLRVARARELEDAKEQGYDEGWNAAGTEYRKQVREIEAELHRDRFLDGLRFGHEALVSKLNLPEDSELRALPEAPPEELVLPEEGDVVMDEAEVDQNALAPEDGPDWFKLCPKVGVSMVQIGSIL